jgi:hypothetical protein
MIQIAFAMDEAVALPIACSLDAEDLGSRLDEFRALFSASLRGLRRCAPSLLELQLDLNRVDESALRDLLGREQECCPFFTFDVRISGDVVLVSVGVPPDGAAVLDDFARLTASAP